MRWLGLDVGAERVGVAVCDAEETVVTPLTSVRFEGLEALATVVGALAEERGIGGVVVGVPITRSGQGRGEQRARRVIEVLRRRLALLIDECDERGTTAIAAARLREAGVAARHQRDRIDAVAAAVILEGFLAGRHRAEGRR